MEIGVPVDKAVLARQNPVVPLQAAELQKSSFQQNSRKPEVKLAFEIPPKHARLSVSSPSSAVEIEQDWQQAFCLLHGFTKPEAYFLAPLEGPQHGPYFGSKPWPQCRQ